MKTSKLIVLIISALSFESAMYGLKRPLTGDPRARQRSAREMDIEEKRSRARASLIQKQKSSQTLLQPKINSQSTGTGSQVRVTERTASKTAGPDFPGRQSQTFPGSKTRTSSTTLEEAQIQQKAASTSVDKKSAADDSDKEGRRVGRHRIGARFFGGYGRDYWRPTHDVYVSEPTQVGYYEPTVYEQPLVTTQPAAESKIDWDHIFYVTNDCFNDEVGRLIYPAGSYVVNK